MMIAIKKSSFNNIFHLPLKNDAMRRHISDDRELIRDNSFIVLVDLLPASDPKDAHYYPLSSFNVESLSFLKLMKSIMLKTHSVSIKYFGK